MQWTIEQHFTALTFVTYIIALVRTSRNTWLILGTVFFAVFLLTSSQYDPHFEHWILMASLIYTLPMTNTHADPQTHAHVHTHTHAHTQMHNTDEEESAFKYFALKWLQSLKITEILYKNWWFYSLLLVSKNQQAVPLAFVCHSLSFR